MLSFKIKTKNQPTNHQPTTNQPMATIVNGRVRIPFHLMPQEVPPPDSAHGMYQLDPTRFALENVYYEMPFSDFLHEMARSENMAIFLEDRDEGRSSLNSNRNNIQSLRIIMEMVYDRQASEYVGSTDGVHLSYLLSVFTTVETFEAIYRELYPFLTQMFSDVHLPSGVIDGIYQFRNAFSKCKKILVDKPWFKADALLLEGRLAAVYKMDDERAAAATDRQNRVLGDKLKDIKFVRYSDFLELLRICYATFKTLTSQIHDPGLTSKEVKRARRQAVIYGSIIAQSMCGSRIIEVLRISEYALLPDRVGWIHIHKVAKSDHHKPYEEAPAAISITKPLVFLDTEGMPTAIEFIALIKDIRQLVADLGYTRMANDELSNHFTGMEKTILSHLWSREDLEATSGGVSHIFRKLYASLSYWMFCLMTQAENSWYQMVLGHSTPMSSMNYMTIKLTDISDIARHRQYDLQELRDKVAELMEFITRQEKKNKIFKIQHATHHRVAYAIKVETDRMYQRKRKRNDDDDDVEMPSSPDTSPSLPSPPPDPLLDEPMSDSEAEVEPETSPVVPAPVPIASTPASFVPAPSVHIEPSALTPASHPFVPSVDIEPSAPPVPEPKMIDLTNRLTGGTLRIPYVEYPARNFKGPAAALLKAAHYRDIYDSLDFRLRDADVSKLRQKDHKLLGVSQPIFDAWKKQLRDR